MPTVRVCRLTPALAILLAAGAALGADVRWRAAPPEPAGTGVAPAGADAAVAGLAAAAGAPRFVARFESPLSAGQRAALRAAGLRVLAPLGGSSYIVRREGVLDAARVASVAPARSAHALTRAHKLERSFLEGRVPEWALVPGPDGRDMAAAYVVFHADAEVTAAPPHELVERFGGRVMDVLTLTNALVVELPPAAIDALAADDSVQWIEPPMPRMGGFNDSNRAVTQAASAQGAPYNLDGSGVTVFVYDGGSVRATHNDFSGRVTVLPADTSGTASHATHVAGTIGGDGSVLFNNRGMAPGVTMLSAGFEYDGSGIFLYSNPGDIEADYADAIAMGADIANNSIGTNTAPNGFPCSIEGDYGVTAATIDAIVRGGLGAPIIVFWSAGNERGSNCGELFRTSPAPTNNKNAITVGALNSNNDSVTSFTSWGPSDDGRLRPIISGPGCQSNADFGVTSTTADSNNSYGVSCGTSMSGPTLTGLGALVLEDFRVSFPGAPDPSNALMKALLCAAAADVDDPGPDFRTGYGSARVVDTINLMRTAQWDDANAVDHNGIVAYTLNVAPGAGQLEVTAAWDDVPSTPNVLSTLVNDLDLVVTDPAGNRHYPWTLDPNNPDAPAVRTREDHANNIEQVRVSNPMAGAWHVQVVGASVPAGPQRFAAVFSGGSVSTGPIGLDIATQTPAELPPFTPLEIHAAAADGAASVLPGSVTLHHRAGPGPFTATPMAPHAGLFSATIPGAPCGSTVEYYVTADASSGVTFQSPPGETFTVPVGQTTVLWSNPLDLLPDTNGWVISGPLASSAVGRWTWGVPNGGGNRGDPAADADGAGGCWVTGNGPGDTDVDGGPTVLTTPDLDTTVAADPVVSYARWYHNAFGATPNTDPFTVEISNNAGANWTTLEVLGPTGHSTFGEWNTASFRVADFVAPTAQVRLRFTANDAGSGSVVEAAIDDLAISEFVCTTTQCGPADLDANGVLNVDDVALWASAFLGGDPLADCDANTALNADDIECFVAAFAAGCP